MKITIVELKKFANDSKNEIELRECDSNAKKVYAEYQAKIYTGTAVYIEDGTFSDSDSEPKPHYWNVRKFKSESGVDQEQIIDIYNYKINKEGEYSKHSGKEYVIIT